MARKRASARFWWWQPRCRIVGGFVGITAAALLLLPGYVRAEPGLPDRLELEPAPAGIPSPDALLEEARQCAARVTRPTYGPSVARLVQEMRQAVLLRRALASVEGRFWPPDAGVRPALPGLGSGPAFFRDGQLARGRALDVIA